MQRIKSQRYFVATLYFLASFAYAMDAIENDTGYLESVITKINEFTKESEHLFSDIHAKKNRVAYFQNASGIIIVVLPYSISWVVDAYMPSALWVKEALHYSITPITQITGILMLHHNFTQAKNNVVEAESTLKESFYLFNNLGQVCKKLTKILGKTKEQKQDEAVEKYFIQLHEDNAPVGRCMISVLHKLQKNHIIGVFLEPNKRLIFCEIFSIMLETINNIKPSHIKTKNIILNFNGISLLSYDFLSLEKLEESVVESFKTYSFGKNSSFSMPFMNNKDRE